jgi:hypothetical protein
MPRPNRLSAEEETDLWWQAKLADLERRGRLAKDGRILSDPSFRGPYGHLSPQEINSLLIARPVRLARLQVQEVNRLRGRRPRSWRRAFDKSETCE